MPKHSEETEFANGIWCCAALCDEVAQRDSPDDAHENMKSVRSDECEERGEEGAMVWAVTVKDKFAKLVELECQKPDTE